MSTSAAQGRLRSFAGFAALQSVQVVLSHRNIFMNFDLLQLLVIEAYCETTSASSVCQELLRSRRKIVIGEGAARSLLHKRARKRLQINDTHLLLLLGQRQRGES